MKQQMLHNNKGETLVEIIIGVLLLAIASVCLISGFVTSANIVNRANLMKNSSAAVSSTLELEKKYDVGFADLNNEKIVVTPKKKATLNIEANNAGEIIKFQVNGVVIKAEEKEKTKLKYREFFPSNYNDNQSNPIK